MKLSDVKIGETLYTDAGFTCMQAGPNIVEADEAGRLFIKCGDGRHYLDGQLDFADQETLVGLRRFPYTLALEPYAQIPEGYSAPLDTRTTNEMMFDRDRQKS
jgi:hypothetical protein